MTDALNNRLHKGFTLVEMLVVIAIIAVLVSILLPSLQKAKEYAHLSACISNAGQMGKMLEAGIANENLKKYPTGCYDITYNDPSGALPSWWRLNSFKSTVPVVPETCGGTATRPAKDYGDTGLVCPATKQAWPSNGYGTYIKSNYAMNYFVSNHPTGSFQNVAGHPHPDSTILFGESLWHYYAVDGWKGGNVAYYNAYFPDHHLGKLNYIMFDYSVKSMLKPVDEFDLETCDAPGQEGDNPSGSGNWQYHWCYYNRYGVAYTDELW